MARLRVFSLKQIGEYYNTAHLIRPVNVAVVDDYAAQMVDGAKFPSIVLGTYPAMKSGSPDEKLIIDGVHIYRACQVAKTTTHAVEIIKYGSLADALADQLKRNAHHGLRLTAAQRDARIRQLIEVYNWSTRQVAAAVGMDHSSVSRINRKKQNVSGTGQRGASTEARGTVVPHALPPRQFIRAIENLALTLDKPEARAQALAEIYNPKREPKEIQRFVATLRQVADHLAELVEQPRRRVGQAAQLAATA
jgi:transcriptional regulator with XRE-family HTH domain